MSYFNYAGCVAVKVIQVPNSVDGHVGDIRHVSHMRVQVVWNTVVYFICIYVSCDVTP